MHPNNPSSLGGGGGGRQAPAEHCHSVPHIPVNYPQHYHTYHLQSRFAPVQYQPGWYTPTHHPLPPAMASTATATNGGYQQQLQDGDPLYDAQTTETQGNKQNGGVSTNNANGGQAGSHQRTYQGMCGPIQSSPCHITAISILTHTFIQPAFHAASAKSDAI